MSSRFVSAGNDQVPASDKDDWAEAKQAVESQRNAKAIELGKQEGGKSLYDVLQANKAAKQDAFEEAAKLRNQFRALDDSEIEFLDSVRETETQKEQSVRLETAKQLDSFRKQQSDTGEVNINLDQKTTIAEAQSLKDDWTASKKRRRDKDERDASTKKLQKPSIDEEVVERNGTNLVKPGLHIESEAHDTQHNNSVAVNRNASDTVERPTMPGLGLTAYDSDDE